MSNTVTTNMLDAKTQLSRLVELVESGEVDEVIIARNGRPAAKLVRLTRQPIRLGVAKGLFTLPECIDTSNDEVRRLLEGDDDAAPP